MVDSNESVLNTLKDIQSLSHFLKSEMSIGEPDNGEIIATINVHNDAPQSSDKGDVVFLGVGLRIIVGSEKGSQRGSNYWPSKIKKSRPSDKTELRHTYDEGTWIGGTGASFPSATADEQSHGEVLFPGESVVYEIKTSESELPYLDVRVEGSVSRRHLFHSSQPMEALKPWTQPVIAETFRALGAIDFYSPLVSLSKVMPAWGPQTTIAEMDALRAAITKAKDHVGKVMQDLNNIYHSAPNQKIRDYMKLSIGQYLTTAAKMCDRTLEALSGSDTRRMQEAAEEMKNHLLKAEQVKRGQAELKSQFGVDS